LLYLLQNEKGQVSFFWQQVGSKVWGVLQ